MDINYLFLRQQTERSRAETAGSDVARKIHEQLATEYERLIEDATKGASRSCDRSRSAMERWCRRPLVIRVATGSVAREICRLFKAELFVIFARQSGGVVVTSFRMSASFLVRNRYLLISVVLLGLLLGVLTELLVGTAADAGLFFGALVANGVAVLLLLPNSSLPRRVDGFLPAAWNRRLFALGFFAAGSVALFGKIAEDVVHHEIFSDRPGG